MRRLRLLEVLVTKGLAPNVDTAAELIAEQRVLVNGSVATNDGRLVSAADQIHIVSAPRFVSRGGEKLDHALEEWNVRTSGLTGVDFGSSTGGFTDCLLQRGVARVWAVDVGVNLLHEKLRNDERVEVLEGINVRSVGSLPLHVADIVVADLSFISATAAIPAVNHVAREDTTVILLVKPQFEATREEADKSRGIVTDPRIHSRVLDEVGSAFLEAGWQAVDVIESPIHGTKGNQEFLIRFTRVKPVETAD